MQTAIASVLVFGLLILVHELGHYFVARLVGIRVLELAIGFGPKIFGWTKNGIDYSLRIFPLGGFCRMLGEDPAEANEPDSFPQRPLIQRAAVLLSGATMNLLFAILAFFVIFFFITGVPDVDSSQIGIVISESPAAAIGLESGDRIMAIDGVPTTTWDDVLMEISSRPNEEIALLIERDGLNLEFNITTLASPETGRGRIGIAPVMQRYLFFPSASNSLERFGFIVAYIAQVVTGQAPFDVTGPVGIISTIGEVAQTGFTNLLMLAALISISLGIMNLLPIPALDGGRLFFLFIEAVRRRRIDPEKEGMIHFIGFALLIVLLLFITYQDLIRLNILPGN